MFRTLIMVRALVVICSFGYVEIIKYLTIKYLIFCRLFTCAPVRPVYSHLYDMWRIVTFYGGYMDGRMPSRLYHHHLK
jgi:hypothetical protein